MFKLGLVAKLPHETFHRMNDKYEGRHSCPTKLRRGDRQRAEKVYAAQQTGKQTKPDDTARKSTQSIIIFINLFA
jgi:hypothetical protein